MKYSPKAVESVMEVPKETPGVLQAFDLQTSPKAFLQTLACLLIRCQGH